VLSRCLLTGDIVRPNTANVPRESVMSDFAVGPFRVVSRGSPDINGAFPCVIDVQNARTLYVTGLERQQILKAPFAHLYARRHAKTVLSVPWEAGSINRPRVRTDPIYVFSSGRCGSTLLHNILLAANIPSVSEPGIAAGLISPAYGRHRLTRPLLRWATKCFIRDVMSALGSVDDGLVIKLPSQSCGAVRPLVNGSRERRTVFMFRQFGPWAKSVTNTFSKVNPYYLVTEYTRAVDCYAYLMQRTRCHAIRFEDLLENPYKICGELAEFLNREIPAASAKAAMSVHSQAGTRLEKASEKGRARWEEIREETLALWKASSAAEFANKFFEPRGKR
jgi:hypothetical protein